MLPLPARDVSHLCIHLGIALLLVLVEGGVTCCLCLLVGFLTSGLTLHECLLIILHHGIEV